MALRESFKALGRAMAAAAPACGLAPGAVRALAPGVAEITGTGVSIFWAPDACDGEAGWLVRETFEERDGSTRPPVTQTVAAIPEEEAVRAAKCAMMLAVERRMDVALASLD